MGGCDLQAISGCSSQTNGLHQLSLLKPVPIADRIFVDDKIISEPKLSAHAPKREAKLGWLGWVCRPLLKLTWLEPMLIDKESGKSPLSTIGTAVSLASTILFFVGTPLGIAGIFTGVALKLIGRGIEVAYAHQKQQSTRANIPRLLERFT